MILIAILLVGGAFLLAEYRNKNAEMVYTVPIVSTSTDLQNLSDSTDWKQILLANDKATTTAVKDLTKTKAQLTPTDLLARNFFAKYMAASESGIADDAQVQQDIINNVLSSDTLAPNPILYSSKDIKYIVNDPSPTAQKKYVADIINVLKNYPVAGISEPEIAKSSFDNGDVSILAQIDPKIDGYKKTLSGLFTVAVPSSLLSSHVDLVNAMSKMLYVAEGLRKSGADPLRGVQGMALYVDANTSLMASMDTLNSISK